MSYYRITAVKWNEVPCHSPRISVGISCFFINFFIIPLHLRVHVCHFLYHHFQKMLSM